MTLDEIRDRIVTAAEASIAFDGWSRRSLRAGAVAAGLDPAAVDQAFPEGPAQAVAWWLDLGDRRLQAAVESQRTDSMRVRDRVALAVRLRIGLYGEPETLRRALAVLAVNPATALRAFYNTVDALWHAAGDTATDFNFYTKRALLAGAYGGTILFWLGDASEDSAATWEFLDHRLAELMRASKAPLDFGKELKSFNAKYLPKPALLFRSRPRRYSGA